MPIYAYRREDGTTFEIRQSFNDSPLELDPQTGQKVQRIIQNAGVIFKGSGFYVTDTRGANRAASAPATPAPATDTSSAASAPAPSAD